MDQAASRMVDNLAELYEDPHAFGGPGRTPEGHAQWQKEHPGTTFACFLIALFLFILGNRFQRKRSHASPLVDYWHQD